jgi:zinc finger protein
MTQKATFESECPLCEGALVFNFSTDDIPFFGEIMLVAASCSCGFKYADTITLTEGEAMRFEMEFDCEDFSTRVIRSSAGTLHIPELGVTIEPGPASEAFISNIEGVLRRVEEVITMATKWSSHDPRKFKLGNKLLKRIDKLRRGEGKMTLVIDDPFGNSGILSPRAQRRVLTNSEASNLKTGIQTADISV